MPTPPTSFRTPRLILRCPQPGDGPLVHAAVTESFPELTPWLTWAKEPQTRRQAEAYAQLAHQHFLANREYDFTGFRQSNLQLIMKCSVHEIDHKSKKYEIGYWCRTRSTGQGFVHEAVGGLIRWAAAALPGYTPIIRCDELNTRSQRVAERLGFTRHARIKNDGLNHHGRLHNTLLFVLSPDLIPTIDKRDKSPNGASPEVPS